MVCDGYVKYMYEEAEVDRLVAILKTTNCGVGVLAADRVEYSKQPASARAA